MGFAVLNPSCNCNVCARASEIGTNQCEHPERCGRDDKQQVEAADAGIALAVVIAAGLVGVSLDLCQGDRRSHDAADQQ